MKLVAAGNVRPERVVGVARQTITIDGGRLFARMGSGVTAHARDEDLLTAAPGLVVGLDLESEGKVLEGFPLRTPGDHWAFEGTPVSDGDSLYLLLRYRDEVRSQFHVACYSIQSGRQRWRQQVCAAGTCTRHPASSSSLTAANPTLGRNKSARHVTNKPTSTTSRAIHLSFSPPLRKFAQNYRRQAQPSSRMAVRMPAQSAAKAGSSARVPSSGRRYQRRPRRAPKISRRAPHPLSRRRCLARSSTVAAAALLA